MMPGRLACLAASLWLSACASAGLGSGSTAALPPRPAVPLQADAETIETGPFALTVTPPALRDNAALVQAQLSGTEVLGLFNVSSQYDVQQGNRQHDARVLGRQRWAQDFQTSLPLPFGSPLLLGANSQLEQRFTPDGVLAAQQQGLQARWNGGDLRFALDARAGSQNSASRCELDASLSTPLPMQLGDGAADAGDLRLGGQLCQRTLASGLPQRAQIFSAQTAWDDALGASRLRISHAALRDQPLTGQPQGEAAVGSGGIELGARRALQLGGWSLTQEFALRSADRREQAGGWAARSQVSRKLGRKQYRIPVTASWQRHDAAVWALGSTQASGTETSLGFDLSAPLQQWLTQSAGANLSYHRLDPADKKIGADDQVRLGISLGW